MDDLRPTQTLARLLDRRLATSRSVGNKTVLVLSKTGRPERLLKQAKATFTEAVIEGTAQPQGAGDRA